MSEQQLAKKRSITVFSTVGKIGKVIETTATTWGQLQQEVVAAGFSLAGMKVITGDQVTLESKSAIIPVASIPENDCLFLMPVKTKSGI